MLVVPLAAALVLAAPQCVQLNVGDNGRTVALARSTPVSLRLVSNPSTGFRWKLLTLDRKVVKMVSHRYVAPTATLVGAPGHEVWRFRAVARGTTTLRLVYVRPWAPKDVEKRFHVVLKVRP